MKALTKISKTPKDWKVIDKPVPAYDDDQVLIRVEYIGICGSDVHTYEGHYNVNAENLTIGHEFAGVVAEVGKNVTNVKVGDRVTSKQLSRFAANVAIAKKGNIISARRARDLARNKMAQ